MKNIYEKPQMDMVKYEVSNVITLSVVDSLGGDSSQSISSRSGRIEDDGTGTRVRKG